MVSGDQTAGGRKQEAGGRRKGKRQGAGSKGTKRAESRKGTLKNVIGHLSFVISSRGSEFHVLGFAF